MVDVEGGAAINRRKEEKEGAYIPSLLPFFC
jgi:hypothetical protein